jgi:hypothetical protein
MNHKRLRNQWKRKRPTGFVRQKRTSIRARKRFYAALLKESMAQQIIAGAKSLTEGKPEITEV